MPTVPESKLEEREIGPVTVLFGEGGGKYPDGNSLLVRGSRESVMIDPSNGVVARAGSASGAKALWKVDRVLNSHCHEDHIAGNHLFPDVPWHVHEADLPGFRSIDDMLAIYGYGEPVAAAWKPLLIEQFHYVARPDARGFRDGDVFDLGGVAVRVVHAPGHTRGHSLLVVEWGARGASERVVYLGDIDLSSFGPYYGDAWSSLEDFERSLRSVRRMEAAWYATFHHIGVVDRPAFLERLDRFEAKIAEREERLLEYLEDPHTLEQVVAHRFVYRPGVSLPFVDAVERRSMGMHLDRLLARDRIEEVEPGRFVAVDR